MQHFYALIMAGGGGTRLWPLSRKNLPKQMLPLTEERTLFQITVERLAGLLPPERIFVVTGETMAPPMQASTPQLPAANFVVEPSGRDSGPAAGLGIFHIAQQDPDAVIAILSADHHIAQEADFRDALALAHDYALQGYIVTLGIEPTVPSTGFGYIHCGEALGGREPFTVYRSLGFKEKPTEEVAVQFLADGSYRWNAGMFIMKASVAMAEFARQRPAMYTLLKEVTEHPEQLAAEWPKIEKLSIDYAIMEKAQNVAVIPVSIGWSDVGTWSALYEVLPHDDQGHATAGSGDVHLHFDSSGNLIHSEKMVVTMGVDNLVVIVTDDAVLVCHRDKAQDVKKVVDFLKARGDSRL